MRAAGTWILRSGMLPGLVVEVEDGDAMLSASLGQLDDGADLVKLYLDGPDKGVVPDQIIATKYINDNPASGISFTRPLCVFPRLARYTGTGNAAMAAARRRGCVGCLGRSGARGVRAVAGHGGGGQERP